MASDNKQDQKRDKPIQASSQQQQTKPKPPQPADPKLSAMPRSIKLSQEED
jgi:hypothetical protein